jgi:D-glycero-alpha-D-manno-heptose 1-phosphate guanylyltransferase
MSAASYDTAFALKESLRMEAIVLAGGLGTRLAARLKDVPKPMALVAGRPFLEILLLQLRRAGCTRVILSVGHLHTVIQKHFGHAFEGMRVDYAIEAAPLGTGGAIRMALRQAEEDSVLAMNGDTFRQTDYAAMMRFHSAEGAAATMAVMRQPDIARYGGVVVKEGRVVAFVEKGRSGPGWINAGVYVLSRNLDWPSTLGEKFSIETDFFAPEVARLRPAAYEMHGYFLDIGIPADLDRAQTELAEFLK